MKTNKSYLLIAAVLTFLFALQPTHTMAQENIVDRLNKALNLKLPAEYDAKVREFTKNNEILKDKDVNVFTEKFIVEQMKADWGINRQNQYLFIVSDMFKQLTKNKDYDIYDASDGSDDRLEEYSNVMDKSEECGIKYREGLEAYEIRNHCVMKKTCPNACTCKLNCIFLQHRDKKRDGSCRMRF